MQINTSYIIASAATDYSIRLWTIQGQFLGLFGTHGQWRNIRSLITNPIEPKKASTAAKGTTTEIPIVVDPLPAEELGRPGRNSARIGLPTDLRRVASYTTMFILETEADTRRNSRWSVVRNAAAWICAFLQTRKPAFLQEVKTTSTFTIPGARPEKAAPYSNNLREMIDEYEKGAMTHAGYRRRQQDLRAQAAERDANLLRPLPPQTSSILGKSYRKPTRYRPIQRLTLDESVSGEVGILTTVTLNVHDFLKFNA